MFPNLFRQVVLPGRSNFQWYEEIVGLGLGTWFSLRNTVLIIGNLLELGMQFMFGNAVIEMGM